jgi:hypothetical protein
LAARRFRWWWCVMATRAAWEEKRKSEKLDRAKPVAPVLWLTSPVPLLRGSRLWVHGVASDAPSSLIEEYFPREPKVRA